MEIPLFTYCLSTATVTLTKQLGKIVKNFVKPCLSEIPRKGKGLITLNETIQKLFTLSTIWTITKYFK